MKIALVISHPVQHFCPQYASFASNKNISFKVFFGSALGFKKYIDPNFSREVEWDNLRLDEFPHVFLNGEVATPVTKEIDAPVLDKELELYAPDIVVIYGYYHNLQKRAYNWAVKNKVRIAYISDSERNQKRGIFKDWAKHLFLRKYFSAIDFFLSVGNANRNYYKYYGVPDRKITLMHFPIDLQLYTEAYKNRDELRKQIRDKFSIGENELVISMVGKVIVHKCQDHIIKAMKLLEAENIVMHLFVIGSGPAMEEVKKAAATLKFSKVHFTGFCDPGELPAYYAASDIYVHASRADAHSLAVSEAIFMGCPAIISDRCGSYGPDDDVQVGRNGFVYEFGNIEALADKIKQLTDPSVRELYSQASHTIANEFQQQSHFGIIKDLEKEMSVA